jgi:NAD(P)-dependent dehydrogenase (short-subunit alcohol dehydrogenase family)
MSRWPATRYVLAAFEAYGAIDCFFNNAGIEGVITPAQDYDEAMFDRVIGVNLIIRAFSWGCAMCCR